MTENRREAFLTQLADQRGISVAQFAKFGFSPDELRQYGADFIRGRANGIAADASPTVRSMVEHLSFGDWVRCHDPRHGQMDPDSRDTDQILTRAMTSSDFTASLANTIAEISGTTFDRTVAGAVNLARPVGVSDFKSTTLARVGVGTLDTVADGAAYERLRVTEGQALEDAGIEEHGGTISFSRKVFYGDNAGLLLTTAMEAGGAQGRTLLTALTSKLESTANLADGRAPFNATDGNLVAAGAAPSTPTLDEAIQILRGLTNPAGDVVGVGPRFLVVHPALETVSRGVINHIWEPGDPARVELVVLPWLTDSNAWYLMGDPQVAPALTMLHLGQHAGRPFHVEPVRTKASSSGVDLAVTADFAFLWTGRFAVKNPGA
ncbi:MAG: hypothetical protein U5S82_14070 [Gammaproteobacteria bacterium]|nr:hypothetical protein [Gammaproteobacteria bacterium]